MLPDRFPKAPGTYILVLQLPRRTEFIIGRFGLQVLPRGSYLYVGSAFGPGGLRARLAHHLRPKQRCHWHVDSLQPEVLCRGIYYTTAAESLEHAWAAVIAAEPGASVPVPGFGSTDCTCTSHLFRLPGRPQITRFKSLLGQAAVCESTVRHRPIT